MTLLEQLAPLFEDWGTRSAVWRAAARDLRKYLEALRAPALEVANRWKEEITDAAVVNWVLSQENANDPKKLVYDLMACAEREALDPQISKNARRLIQHGMVKGFIRGMAMATAPKPAGHNHRTQDDVITEIIDRVLEELMSVDPTDHRTALEELQSRATAALEALESDEAQEHDTVEEEDK